MDLVPFTNNFGGGVISYSGHISVAPTAVGLRGRYQKRPTCLCQIVKHT